MSNTFEQYQDGQAEEGQKIEVGTHFGSANSKESWRIEDQDSRVRRRNEKNLEIQN